MYTTVFAFAVLKIFCLRDDVLELLQVKCLKKGGLGLCKILMKCVLLKQAIKSYREGSSLMCLQTIAKIVNLVFLITWSLVVILKLVLFIKSQCLSSSVFLFTHGLNTLNR